MSKRWGLLFGFLFLIGLATLPTTAFAGIHIQIDISSQTMRVTQDGRKVYGDWRISSARGGSYTPRGNFGVQSLKRHHRSSIYNNAPMPHSIFFSGNYAIHGTPFEKRLGRPGSHGCVRLSLANAARLFSLVRKAGPSNVSISIKN